MNPHLHALLIKLLEEQSLQRGTFRLAGGRFSEYYIDVRLVSLSSSGARLIAGGVFDVVDHLPVPIAAVGGIGLGAATIVGAVLFFANEYGPSLRGFVVRDKAKDHGTGKRIEGPVYSGDHVLVVEDVTTTGGSALRAVDAALDHGCTVAGVVTVLDRLEGAAAAFAARDIPFYALTTIRDLGLEPLPPA
jgi:orotate phosphoribosyltransferase